jgi:hypothetical protein
MINWALKTISGLAIVFIVAYFILWALWQWLFLSLIILVIGLILHRKYGIIGKNGF